MPICIGQLLEIHERRPPGEIAGFYMLRGGAPCVIDAYLGYFERFIAEQRLADLFLFDPRRGERLLRLRPLTLAQHSAGPAGGRHHRGDRARSPGGRRRRVARGSSRSGNGSRRSATSLEQFHAGLPGFVERLAALPRQRDPLDCPRVVVTGDFFTRFSPFFMEGVRDLYATAASSSSRSI